MPNITEVTAEHMSALKALAGVNLKVSEARNSLNKLQEEETEYLISREKKAVDRIQKVLEQSHQLVEETNKNYEVINDLAKSVAEGARFLSEAQESFSKLIEAKDQKYQEWENSVKNQEETIVALRNGLKVDLSTIESARFQVEGAKVKLREDQRKLNDERGVVERQIKRIKENRT